MKLTYLPACLAAAQALSMAAQAVSIDTKVPTSVTLVVGQVRVPLEGTLSPTEKPGESVWELTSPLTWGGDDGIQINSLAVDFNQDPSISYGLAVIDFGAPTSFSFSFTTPIIPTSNPAVVTSSFSASFTKGASKGTFSFTPTLADGDGDSIAEAQAFSVFDGVYKNAGLDLGQAFSQSVAGGFSGSLPTENEGPIAAPAGGAFTGLKLDVGFKLNGGGDILTANGNGTIEERPTVPDSGSVLSLFGLACLGFGLTRNRRA